MSLTAVLLALEVLPLPSLAEVNSLCRWGDKLYIAGQGGVGVVSTYYPMTLLHGLATQEPVLLAAPDPTNGDVFFISGGWLWRWYPGSPDAFKLAEVSGRSLGVGTRNLYIDHSVFTKGGARSSGDPSSDNVVWAGSRVNLSKNDPELAHLAPYYVPTMEMGNVDMTVFYPDMRDLWVGTWGRGVYKYRRQSWLLTDSACPTPSLTRVYAVSGDSHGVWIGGDQGSARLKDGYWLTYNKKGRMFWCEDTRAVEMARDTVFLGTSCGLMRKRGGRFILTRTREPVLCLDFSGDRLWVGTERGLFWTTLGTNSLNRVPGLETFRINDVLSGSWGTLALTDRGAFLVSCSLGVSVLEDPRAFLAGNIDCGFVQGDTAFIVGNGGLALWDGNGWDYMNLPFSPVSQRAHAIDGNEDFIAIATDQGAFFYYRKDGRWERATRFYGLGSDLSWDVFLMGDSAYLATDKGLVKVYLNR